MPKLFIGRAMPMPDGVHAKVTVGVAGTTDQDALYVTVIIGPNEKDDPDQLKNTVIEKVRALFREFEQRVEADDIVWLPHIVPTPEPPNIP